MANFGLMDKPYIKLGSSADICYSCLKTTCERERRDVYDVSHELKGRLADQQTFYIRKGGQDTCICFDCFKKIYEEIIIDEMPVVEEKETLEIESSAPSADIAKETDKKSTTKKK